MNTIKNRLPDLAKTIFLGVIILFGASCAEVVTTEPVPFSGGDPVYSLPEYLIGDFVLANRTYPSFGMMGVNGISVWQEDHITVFRISKQDDNEYIRYDWKQNITYSEKSDFEKKKLKLFEKDGKFFVNIPKRINEAEVYWRFFIFEELPNDKIKLTLSEYDREHFEDNETFYKSNSNFMKQIEGSQEYYLVYDYIDDDEFDLILNDRTLLASCIFKRK